MIEFFAAAVSVSPPSCSIRSFASATTTRTPMPLLEDVVGFAGRRTLAARVARDLSRPCRLHLRTRAHTRKCSVQTTPRQRGLAQAARRLKRAAEGECSFIYRYILRESCSQFDSLPLTSLTMRAARAARRCRSPPPQQRPASSRSAWRCRSEVRGRAIQVGLPETLTRRSHASRRWALARARRLCPRARAPPFSLVGTQRSCAVLHSLRPSRFLAHTTVATPRSRPSSHCSAHGRSILYRHLVAVEHVVPVAIYRCPEAAGPLMPAQLPYVFAAPTRGHRDAQGTTL